MMHEHLRMFYLFESGLNKIAFYVLIIGIDFSFIIMYNAIYSNGYVICQTNHMTMSNVNGQRDILYTRRLRCPFIQIQLIQSVGPIFSHSDLCNTYRVVLTETMLIASMMVKWFNIQIENVGQLK